MTTSAVLLILDDPEQGSLARLALEGAGLPVLEVDGAMAFAEAFAEGGVAACVLSWSTSWTEPGDLVRTLKRRFPACATVVVGEAPPDELVRSGVDAVVPPRYLARLPGTLANLRPKERPSDDSLSKLLDMAGLPWFHVDRGGRLIDANAAFDAVVGAGADTDVLRAIDPELDGSDVKRRVSISGAWYELRLADGWGVLIDVSAEERLARDLADARYQASPVSGESEGMGLAEREQLEQYAHTVAHDLQAPLRTLSIRHDQLTERLGEELDPKAERLLKEAIETVARMEVLVRDLLPSEVTEGVKTDAEQVFDEAVANLAALIEEREATVERGPLPKVPVPRTELLQLLQNLIGNGVRYADGLPLVKVTADRRDGNWVFSVSDNGPGIPLEDSQRIFEAYQRGEVPHAGAGLGLAICKRLVEARGGWIWVDSNNGGSTFQFGLPVD